MSRIICLLLGYALGCFQTAYFVGRLMGKIDIREHESGNAGATNITRVLGAKAGLIVFVCDILKGVVSAVICSLIFSGKSTFTGLTLGESYLPALYGGLGTVLGHNFPAYLKFKGGKGVAASLGVILSVNPFIALIVYACGFVCVFITKYVSLASLVILGMFPIVAALFSYKLEEVLICAILAILVYFQHRENISRLINGKERKFSLKKAGGDI